MVESHHLIHKIVSNAYRRYENLKLKREFRSRIDRINPGEYLDTSCKPNLNVIILVIDCLRNSHLSCQGYLRKTTPFLDSLKSRFTAVSASSWTYPSVASVLTGLYPHNHDAIITGEIKNFDKLENFQKLRGDVLTLPEMLFLLGYRIYFGTAMDPAFYSLRGRVIPTRYEPAARADDLLDDLTRWIPRKKGKFLAYVHLGDLHQPLNPPGGFRDFSANVKNLPNIDMWDFRRPEEQRGEVEKFREYRENRRLLYDNTLRFVDCAIERFHRGLEDAGLVDSTVLAITGDHGEEFWEHAGLEARNFYDPRGYYGVGHGHNVFNEIIQVPLLMSGRVPDSRSDRLASAVDVVPTIVDLLGVSHNMRFDGRNVFDAEGERPLLNEASGYGYEKKALIVGKYKLIYSKDDRVEWLFDLEKDPREQHPIADREVTSVFVEKLHRMLREDEEKRIREIARKKRLSRASILR